MVRRVSFQPVEDHLSRSQSASGSGAESRGSRLDKERQGPEQLKAGCTSSGDVLTRADATSNAKGLGEGLKKESLYSPNPKPLHLEVWSVLKGGVDSLDLNDFERPWPDPKRGVIRSLVAGKDRELCLRAARETREIVQAHDRAPNITSLFEKKLRELAEVRSVVRDSLGAP